MDLPQHLRRGQQAERAAEEMVRRAGCTILARNVRYRCGEIDLIARDRDTVLFVEVRARDSASHGSPEETVTTHKQRRLTAAAQIWLQQHDPAGQLNCRFDVIGILGSDSQVEVRWIKDAFGVQ